MIDKIPFQLRAELETTVSPVADPRADTAPGWRSGLPTLSDEAVSYTHLTLPTIYSV